MPIETTTLQPKSQIEARDEGGLVLLNDFIDQRHVTPDGCHVLANSTLAYGSTPLAWQIRKARSGSFLMHLLQGHSEVLGSSGCSVENNGSKLIALTSA